MFLDKSKIFFRINYFFFRFAKKIFMHSFTEENYLKAIYKLLEQDKEPVTTNAIAARMNTKAASVTDMLKKLSDKKLIFYKKYQGVTLTEKGKQIAITIIRKHRLWEVFLVEKLHFKWDEVHDMAEQLEHIQSDSLIERLDDFLGFPRFDPHGDPIPDRSGRFQEQHSVLLSSLKSGESCIMTGVVDHAPAFLQFLDKNGLGLGDELQIKEIIAYDQSQQLKVNRKKEIYISHEVAKNILVRKKK
ncbi:MAG: Mn-dependent transcriptional regulator [Bacteroidetes bacterium]|nr:MAG: Mn-dependent transcriptional regulator [Bacteroidota bacterium]